MSNTDRYWDVVIEEAAKGVSPPDLRREILARIETPPAPAAARPRAAIRRVLEFAVAACALVAIGVLTGVLRFGGDSVPDDGEGAEVSDPLSVAAAPGTEYVVHDDHIELKQGWLLVTTGAPEIRCMGSVLSRVDGRVLLRAGSMPSHTEAEAVSAWLNENQLEKPMILDARRWIITTAAVLVLSGSAFFDGNLIEASDKEEAPPVEIVWHEVANLMDIELLPEDAHYVRLIGMTGNHIEHVVKHKHIKGLDFGFTREVRVGQLRLITGLNRLEYIDLLGVSWSDEMDYSMLAEIPSLKRAHLPYFDAGGANTPKNASTIARLTDRGAQVSLHVEKAPWSDIELLVASAKLQDVNFGDSSVFLQEPSRMALLASVPTLKRLSVAATDLGLAHLAASNQLEALDLRSLLDGRDGKSALLQVAKMSNLRELSIRTSSITTGDQMLAGLKSLKRLEIFLFSHLDDVGSGFNGLGFTHTLDALTLRSSVRSNYWDVAGLANILASVKARQVSIFGDAMLWMEDSQQPLELPAMPHIEEFSFVSRGVPNGSPIPYESKAVAKLIEASGNIKRVTFVTMLPNVDERQRKQMRKRTADQVEELRELTNVEITATFVEQ